MKTKFLNLLAALALAAAALATHSAAAYGAVAVGVDLTGNAGPLVVRFTINQPTSDNNLANVQKACDDAGPPGNGGPSTPHSCRASSNQGNSHNLQRECFAVWAQNYASDTQRITNFNPIGGIFIARANIEVAVGGDISDTSSAVNAVTTKSEISFYNINNMQLVDLSYYDGDASNDGDSITSFCDTTPLSTCHSDAAPNNDNPPTACITPPFDPATECTDNQAANLAGTACEECGAGTRPVMPSRANCEFDPTSCGENQYSDGDSCEPCSNINRQAGAAGANCGACSSGYMHADATGGQGDACTHDPDSCLDNQYSESGSCMDSCSDINRATMPGASCGACEEFHTTNLNAPATPSEDAAGNHNACTFDPDSCPNNMRADTTNEECLPCGDNQRQHSTDSTMCEFDPDSCALDEFAELNNTCVSCGNINRVAGTDAANCGDCMPNFNPDPDLSPVNSACEFAPTSCGENEYADTTDETCESCGDINRQAGAAGADCGACVANYTHADAIGGEGDACTFDPTSCTGMAQFSPGNTATECGTCATLNREGADGISCGTCLTDFEHATENDGGITECTAIDGGGDGDGDGDFGVVLPMLPDSEVISGQGTTDMPYTVPSDSLTAFMFPVSMAIANGSGNYSYRLDASSSPQLQIDEDGVVSFTAANVDTATYSIIIEITDTTTSETTTVTIVVAVAETTPDVRCEGGTVNSDNVCECPGETSLSNGACVCPSGTENNGQDECEPLPPACVGGTVDDDNICICPGETSLSGGACVCPSGMVNNGANMCVIACTGGTVSGGVCICPLETTLNNGVCSAIVEGPIPSVRSESSKLALGIGAGLAAFMLFYVVADYPTKADDIVIYEPSYSFQHNNGNMQYSLGSRWTAAADNWRFYWQTRQDGGDNGGQFHYGSGMQYHNGIFLAALNSQSDEEQTALDVSFSAAKTAGLWQLGGRYNFDLQSSDTQIDTQNRVDISADYTFGGWLLSAAARHDTDNRLNVAARYVVDKWILAANANTDGDGATAKINYSYRF